MQNDDHPARNGIETCEDLCTCGEHLRLHTYIFGVKRGKPEAKYYVDCAKCKTTSSWHNAPEEAIEDFDNEVRNVSVALEC